MRILVADPIADEGVALLRSAGAQVDVRTGLSPADFQACLPEYDALIVRSETQVTAEALEAASHLQVVGRAGVGVDNIDVDAATKRGVIVVNAPTSNIVAAAEHTMALMLSLARHIPQANAALKAGEWARKRFIGTELRGKTLGIIGLGKVGTEVARRANAFEMRILAHDPFVSQDLAQRLNVELRELDDLLKEADFITVHVPKIPGAKALIGAPELAKVKPSLRIINAARGGVVDEQALYDAVEEGRVAGAAVDTFSVEPALNNILLKSDRIITTPHLGASTEEAQANVAVEVAEEVLAVLRGAPARHGINAPMVLPEALKVLAPFVDVGRTIGKVATQLAEGQLETILISYAGEIAEHDTIFLKAAVIQGLLEPVSEERVNVVNANMIASQRGMAIAEKKETASQVYRSLLTVTLTTTAGKTTVAGTNVLGQVHIVGIDDYHLDVRAGEGNMLIIENLDNPGLIGKVGTIAGRNDVNISFMEVGRLGRRDRAMMAVGLDEPMPEQAIEEMLTIPGFERIRQVTL